MLKVKRVCLLPLLHGTTLSQVTRTVPSMSARARQISILIAPVADRDACQHHPGE